MSNFNYDPFAHIPREQCTVGALRAQATDVDTTPVSHGTGKFQDDGIVTAMTLAERMAEAQQMSDADRRPFRVLPALDDENRFFWTSGADGRLRFLRCQSCGYYLHPPLPRCPQCGSRDLAPEAVSGRGEVFSFTVNHQSWDGSTEPVRHRARRAPRAGGPAPHHQHRGRCAADEVQIGLPVQVVFEQHDHGLVPALRPGCRRRLRVTDFERRSIISGIGQSDVGRRLGRTGLDLTIDAALEAIADAGLDLGRHRRHRHLPGARRRRRARLLRPGLARGAGRPPPRGDWHSGGIEGAAQLAAVVNAVMAVGAGLARHVLVYRTVTESTEQGTGGRAGIGLGGGGGGGGAPRMGGAIQWSIPFRAYSAANWLAMNAHRHFHEFGTTPEQMAMIAVNARRNAGLNPKAVYRDPMTLDDYFAVADDHHAVPAVRLRRAGRRVHRGDRVGGRARRRTSTTPVARVEAMATALRGRPSWDQYDDMTTMAARDVGAQLWTRTDLTPADVDIAELYDGFSFLTMTWLEALGFCGKGESGPFIEGGARIALDGELPLNTHGGQLSAGRLHGFGFIHEAVLQLRGEAGDRQVTAQAGARWRPSATAAARSPVRMLLTREG